MSSGNGWVAEPHDADIDAVANRGGSVQDSDLLLRYCEIIDSNVFIA